MLRTAVQQQLTLRNTPAAAQHGFRCTAKKATDPSILEANHRRALVIRPASQSIPTWYPQTLTWHQIRYPTTQHWFLLHALFGVHAESLLCPAVSCTPPHASLLGNRHHRPVAVRRAKHAPRARHPPPSGPAMLCVLCRAVQEAQLEFNARGGTTRLLDAMDALPLRRIVWAFAHRWVGAWGRQLLPVQSGNEQVVATISPFKGLHSGEPWVWLGGWSCTPCIPGHHVGLGYILRPRLGQSAGRHPYCALYGPGLGDSCY